MIDVTECKPWLLAMVNDLLVMVGDGCLKSHPFNGSINPPITCKGLWPVYPQVLGVFLGPKLDDRQGTDVAQHAGCWL